MDHSDKKRLGTVGAFLGTALFVIGLIMKIVTIVGEQIGIMTFHRYLKSEVPSTLAAL